jgi:FixJ family two-component response regulator
VRVALARLLRSMGHTVHLFASAEAFDASPVPSDCLVLDVRLPGLSGLELRDRIRLRGSQVPVVFITGESGPSTRDSARNLNDVDEPLLAKPFSDEELMDAIGRAMAQAVR